jgi:hypothetical protein
MSRTAIGFGIALIVVGVTQLAVSSFPCHYDSRSNPTPARGGKVDESSPV